MNRPARLVVVAVTASTALLLTACGSGGGDDSSSDKIKGADAGGEKTSAGPSATASQDAAGRPKIALSKDFRADFEGWTNSDPKLQAILDDGREELRSKYAAIIESNPDSDAVAFYNSGTSLTSAREWIKSFTDTDDGLIGEVTVYRPRVHINDTGSGVLFYCVDERKASTKNRKTGKVIDTPDKPESVLQYRERLDKTSQGVWKNVSLTTVAGGCG
ncbi:hypothetical protein ACH4S8_14060 [Streptomyces sp. NPDC021080]|uniref:hypothetical protein n=1 Tax=Streptomyces sp. NPDC021080 TaxID=3365110 RepID=UPI0037A6DC3B